MMDQTAIREQLIAWSEPGYRDFAASLIPTVSDILGVRLPVLRKLARTIARGDWKAYLAQAGNDCFEERMLQGMVIGYAKADAEEVLRQVARFVPTIDNWSVCDSFCIGLTFTRANKSLVWDFLQPYFVSSHEYEVRFGVVMLLEYYIEDEYIDRVLDVLDRVGHEGYYAKMAVAWALSICYVKMPARTMPYLSRNSLDDFTYNKALQKMAESTRVDRETKAMLRGMKRKRSAAD